MSAQERTEDHTTGAVTLRQSGEMAISAAAARVEAEIKAAYALAMMNPRDLAVVKQRLMTDCEDLDLAEKATYSRPVGKKDGKPVFATGASVHLMRRAMACMGNMRSAANVIYDDEERSIIVVKTVDYETGAGYEAELNITKTVERQYSSGREVISSRKNSWNNDVYTVRTFDHEFRQKCQIEISKTTRDQIEDLTPLSLISEAQAACKARVLRAINEDPSGYLRRVIAKFEDLKPKIHAKQIMQYLRCDYNEVTPAQILDLLAIYRGVREGEDSWQALTAERPQGGKPDLKPTQGREKFGFDNEQPGQPPADLSDDAPQEGRPNPPPKVGTPAQEFEHFKILCGWKGKVKISPAAKQIIDDQHLLKWQTDDPAMMPEERGGEYLAWLTDVLYPYLESNGFLPKGKE